MRNKYKFYLIFFFLIWFNYCQATELEFESSSIQIIDKDNILAEGDVKIISNTNDLIKGQELKINKKKKNYSLIGGVVYENPEYVIYSDELFVDENNNIYLFKKNVRLLIKKRKIKIETSEISFKKSDNQIKTIGLTKIDIDNNIFIKSKNLLFDRNKKILISNSKSIIKDKPGNLIESSEFKYLFLNDQIFALDVKITDKDFNIFKIEDILYDLKSEKIFAKDISINNNENTISKENLARSKSRSGILDKNFFRLKKTSFTNCKKRDGCAPWSIEAKEVEHNKIEKRITYKNAKIKFFDFPVVYFPKFFHPDPTVERQSGFLSPIISFENNQNFISLPYFFAISENSDFTFSPRIYDNFENIYQGEYRRINENNKHIIDLSIKNGKEKILDKDAKETHIFTNSIFNINSGYFDNSKLEINLQSVSDKKYLKNKNIKSTLLNSQTSLFSNIEYTGNNENVDFTLSTEIYENLSKEKDRYEFILPTYSLIKNLDITENGLSEFRSTGYNKKYNSNINESILINDLNYKSIDKINTFGWLNNWEIFFKNFNSNTKNSSKYKDDINANLQGLFQYNLKIPMKKDGLSYNKYFTPKLSAKINPSKNKNIKDLDRLLIYDNFFSPNRIGNNQVLEGGNSITLGTEYRVSNKNLNEDIFKLNLATSLRDNENQDLPTKSSLGQKMSNVAGQSKFKLNNFIDLNYDFLVDNNFSDMKYHKVETDFRINNFVTSFEFIEENGEIGNESFISNKTNYDLNENNSLVFRTRKNKKTNITEYYDLVYQYKMDCLTAGIQYKKEYYNDGELKPSEKIFFTISIMPSENDFKIVELD